MPGYQAPAEATALAASVVKVLLDAFAEADAGRPRRAGPGLRRPSLLMIIFPGTGDGRLAGHFRAALRGRAGSAIHPV